MKVTFVNHGLANRFENCIEINKHLKKYPQLLKTILEHEYSHTDKSISKQDFKLDMMMPQALHYKQLFKFMIKHPKSFTQLLPFYYTRKRGFVYDVNMILMYMIWGGVLFLTIYFVSGFSS